MQFESVKYQLNIFIEFSDFYQVLFDFYSNFKYTNDGDSGIDLYNPLTINIDSFAVASINHNIKCEMINLETNTYTSYYVVPRSSISKTTLQMANSIGVIDAGYRGEIIGKVRNISINKEIINPSSLFQIISPDLKPIKINLVNTLSNTTRDNGGFGSTDVYKLYFDGSCHPNPNGRCKGGAVLYLNNIQIGTTKTDLYDCYTNNQAEYNGLILGLDYAKTLNVKHIEIYGDSKLVIEQVKGNWKCNNVILQSLLNSIKEKLLVFKSVKLFHIPRSENTIADTLTR